ncbi:hypothetical protein [Hydrogenimonas sp.]
MQLSKGALKDIAVLSLAAGVFKVIMDMDSGECNSEGALVKNPDREIAKRLESLMAEMIERYRAIYGALNRKQQRIVMVKQKEVYDTFMSEAPAEIQLDLFAIYLLHQRFVERDKPLHPVMIWFASDSPYDGLRDMVVASLQKSVGREVALEKEGEMFEAAYRVANMI